VRRILTTDTIITLVNAPVVSRIDYCNAVLTGVHDVHLQQLQRVLKAAVRLIVRIRKYDSISATMPQSCTGFRSSSEWTLLVLVFNCLNNLAPSYLSTMCQPVADNAGRRHRSALGRLRVVISLFQTQEQSATVLAASLLQDCPCGTLFQYCYVAATFHPRSVAI